MKKKKAIKIPKQRDLNKLFSLRGIGLDMRTKSVSLDPSNRKYTRRVKHKLRLLD